MTERVMQIFDVVGGLEMLVTADVERIKRPIRIEECHGDHRFNEDEVNVTLVSVVLNLDNFSVHITDYLSEKEKQLIANELEVY